MAEVLINTKLGIPHIRGPMVERTHLLRRLYDGLLQGDQFQRKLTLVSAPAGYGKTTLVYQWVRKSNLPIAWLSLDEGDNDPSRFMAYLIASLQMIHPNIGKTINGILQSPQRPPFEIISTLLLNEIEAQAALFILVLDDYQVINNLAIHKQISFLLDHLPSKMHLVLITREDPLIPVARLRLRDQLQEIRQDDLRLSVDEISDFMNQVMHLEPTQGDILALERRTEGWVAGLQLAGISMRGVKDKDSFFRALTGSNRFILDFLIEEVFNHQSKDLREFLLKTSILDRLSGPLCDAVSMRTDSRELLHKLEQANMFIVPLDQSGNWYRYHRLFSELLLHQLKISRDYGEESLLHQRASQWFEIEGYPDEAIQHALAARDWGRAAQLIGKTAEAMFKQGMVVTLSGWFEKLPQELILTQPSLCLEYAWALLLSEKYDLAGPVLDQAKIFAPDGSIYFGQVATAQAYLARAVNDSNRVIETSQLALSLLPESDLVTTSNLLMNLGLVYWHAGSLTEAEQALQRAQVKAQKCNNLYAQLTSEVFLARTQASRGAIRQAANWYVTIIDKGAQIPSTALAYFDLGSIYYEWDEQHKAESYLQEGMEFGKRTGNLEFLVAGYILQAYLLLARADWITAYKVGQQAYTLARKFSAQTQARSTACLALIALSSGDLSSAAHWLEQSSGQVDSHPFYRFSGLLWPRLLLAQGRNAEARRELINAYDAASKAGWGYATIAILVLQALAAEKLEQAQEFISDGLLRAQPEGYLRTFVDAGEGLIPILHHAAQNGVTPEYVGKILTAFSYKPKFVSTDHPALHERLSEREIEVLRLVTAGLSNREIAGKLFISTGTAKTHVHNLCGKLGVRNRTEAASRAKELGLV